MEPVLESAWNCWWQNWWIFQRFEGLKVLFSHHQSEGKVRLRQPQEGSVMVYGQLRKKGITNHVLFHLGGNGGETILLKWIEHWAQNNVYLQHSTVRFGQHSSILAKVIWNAKVHESRPHNMQRGLSMPWNVSISPMCGFEPALKRIKLDNTHDSMIDQWCMSSSVTSRIDHMRIHSCPYVWYFCNYILWFIAFHMSDIWYFCTYCNMMHEYNI